MKTLTINISKENSILRADCTLGNKGIGVRGFETIEELIIKFAKALAAHAREHGEIILENVVTEVPTDQQNEIQDIVVEVSGVHDAGDRVNIVKENDGTYSLVHTMDLPNGQKWESKNLNIDPETYDARSIEKNTKVKRSVRGR